MPQLIPYTLELQFNSIIILMTLVVIIISCYVLPIIAKLLVARTHISI